MATFTLNINSITAIEPLIGSEVVTSFTCYTSSAMDINAEIGDTIQLTASGADTYLWTPSTYLSATTGSVVDAIPLTNITYSVQGTTGGCSSIQTISITVNPLPIAGYTYVDNGFGSLSFTDASLNATAWDWNFGDSSGTSTVASPDYTYLADGNYTITQVVSNNCGSDTASLTINVIVTNILSVTANSSIEVYPNPSNGHFNIKYSSSSNDNFTISIINVTGEIVLSKEYSVNASSMVIPVDIAKLAKGIYQIKLNNGEEVLKARILIDRY